jgi:hypothetical protein
MKQYNSTIVQFGGMELQNIQSKDSSIAFSRELGIVSHFLALANQRI